MAAKRAIFIMAQKGGVGKTFFTRGLTQVYRGGLHQASAAAIVQRHQQEQTMPQAVRAWDASHKGAP